MELEQKRWGKPPNHQVVFPTFAMARSGLVTSRTVTIESFQLKDLGSPCSTVVRPVGLMLPVLVLHRQSAVVQSAYRASIRGMRGQEHQVAHHSQPVA